MSHAWEQLRQAVHVLAQTGSPRERLARAFADHLADLRQKDLPAEIRQDFTKLADTLYFYRTSPDAAAVNGRLESVDDAAIGRMITSILAMYDAVARYQPIPAMPQERQRDR